MTGSNSNEGLILVWAVNNGANEPFRYTITETINISGLRRVGGFPLSRPWRISTAWVRDRITVNQTQ